MGDNWLPADSQGNWDSDWQDYYHSEFRGFASVAITSPNNDLTIDSYASTEGWATPYSDFANYGAGQLTDEKVYQGTNPSASALLRETINAYAGGPTLANPGVNSGTACASAANTDSVYTPCEVMILATRTIEDNGATSGTLPSVETDSTYDDYDGSKLVASGYHQLQKEVITSSNAPTLTKQWSYYTNVQVGGSWTYYNVALAQHSEIDDNGTPAHIYQCQYTTYDEGSGVIAPAAGWPTTVSTYSSSNCASHSNAITTTYSGYDAFGNVVATVDGVAQANSSFYSTNGCALTRPTIFTSTSTWGSNLNYTTCTAYDSTYHAQATSVTEPLAPSGSSNLSNAVSYDATQGSLLTSTTDMNGQQTTYAYSYDGNGNRTVQVKQPGETGSYTMQSSTHTSCPTSNTLPCFEIDTNSSLYSNVQSSTFYDAQGRVVETSTPGPVPANPTAGDYYFTVVLIEYRDDSTHSIWKTNPFVVAVPNSQHSSGYVDPSTAVDYTGAKPGGTATFLDALGRSIAVDDPLFNPPAVPGISCPSLGSNATACTIYSLGSANGDSATYAQTTSVDPNDHVTAIFLDALGRTVYGQQYSGTYGSTTLTQQKVIQYNVLNEATSVKVIDEVPGSKPSVTTTTSYDDLGRLVALNDPDRGTHTYTYDADGRVISDTSGTRTLGYSYDLMGRIGCVQDQAPPTSGLVNATGGCSSGANPFAQYTYDVSAPGASWNGSGNDNPKGRLTQTLAINYFPGPDYTQGKVTEQAEYDTRGRTIASNLSITATGGTLTFPTFPIYQLNQQYNDANQPTTAQTSSNPSGLGYTTTQVYDTTTGILTGLSNNGTATANIGSMTYNPQALVNTFNFLSSTTNTVAIEQLGYDGDLRPVGAGACWQGQCGTPPPIPCTSGYFFCQSLNYDAASNLINLSTTQGAISGISNSGGSETQVFCYDEQNRLVWAGNSGTPSCTGNGTPSNSLSGAGYHAAYTYNNLGQLTSGPLKGTGTTYEYLYCNSSHPHELTGLFPSTSSCSNQTGAVYTSSYDAWGNVTTRFSNGGTTANLSYDGLDRLVRWNDTVTTTNEAWYMYDASGNRVLYRAQTGTGGSTTTITIYAFGREEHIYNGAGTLQSSNYYYALDGRLLAKSVGSGAITYFLTDTLGSVLASFNSTALAGNQTYGPYGNIQYLKGQIGTTKGFTGQYKDALTELNSFGARYYDISAGVFLSADTVQGNLQGMNPYAYVGGNPETHSDPTGQMRIQVMGAGSGNFSLQADEAYVYHYVTSPKLGSSGLPALLEMYLYDHSDWILAESYAQNVMHSSTRILLGQEAYKLVHESNINWNANNAMRVLYLRLNGLALSATLAAVGLGVEGSPLAELEELDRTIAASANVLRDESNVTVDDSGNISSNENTDSSSNTDTGGPCSFTSTTQVATGHGEQSIGTLQVGDKVWAYNPKTHKMELETILHVWINHDNDLVDLTLTTTSHLPHSAVVTRTSEVIHTNKKHPFLTLEKGFLAVGQITLGMHVLRADGTYGVVTEWQVVPGTKVMYNLEVAQDHTFTVGAGQFVVHNSSGPSCASGVSYQDLSDAGAALDRNGFTQAGRALQKHANRPGGASTWGVSGASSAELNNPRYLNSVGQDILDNIVTDPNTSWTSYSSAKYGGQIIEGRLPGGLGARWIVTGGGLEFMGLLD